MIFSYFFMMWLIISTLGKDCDNILCANTFDQVCGIAKLKDGTHLKQKYQNICHMRKKACEKESIVDRNDFVGRFYDDDFHILKLEPIFEEGGKFYESFLCYLDEINQVANELCNIKKRKNITKNDEYLDEGRRVNDFSIVGAHQACNHSCPTYCTDSYDPACAQIWKRNMMSYTYRPMINHCHIDLFSCAAGLNVTIQPLGKCYKNPSGLLFMQNVAALKSLKFLDGLPVQRRGINVAAPDVNSEVSLKKHLEEIVRRIFEKYHKKGVVQKD